MTETMTMHSTETLSLEKTTGRKIFFVCPETFSKSKQELSFFFGPFNWRTHGSLDY